VRSGVVTVVTMKIKVLWEMTPYTRV